MCDFFSNGRTIRSTRAGKITLPPAPTTWAVRLTRNWCKELTESQGPQQSAQGSTGESGWNSAGEVWVGEDRDKAIYKRRAALQSQRPRPVTQPPAPLLSSARNTQKHTYSLCARVCAHAWERGGYIEQHHHTSNVLEQLCLHVTDACWFFSMLCLFNYG